MMRFPAAVLLSLSLVAQTPIRVADVRKIYIEKMPANFDQYLRSSILKKFHNRLTIVLDRSIADAVLSEGPMGQNPDKATVNLTDKHANVLLWSGTAGDRNEKFLYLKHGGKEKIADRLADQLKDAMEH
jgi:tRNA G10  N-methylase Trm11